MRVDIPDYGTFVDFPDDTAPEVIERTLRQNFPPKQKEPLTVASLRAKFVGDQSANTDREKAAMVRGEDSLDDTRAGRFMKRLDANDQFTPDVRNVMSTAGARVGAGFEQSAGGLMQAYGEENTNRLGADRAKLEQSRAGRLLNRMTGTETAQRQAIAQKGRDLAAEGRSISQVVNEEKPLQTRAGKIFGNAVESVGANLPGMATTVVTGSPTIGLSMMGAQSFGQAYDEARAKGLAIDDAIASAGIQGGTEVATELLPFVSLAKYLKTGNLSKEVLKYYLADIPSEHVATAIQNAAGAAYSAPNITQEQRLDAAADYLASPQHGQDQIDTFFTTLLQGAVIGGTAKAARSGSQWYQQLKGGTTPPVLPKHEVRIPDTGVANPAVSVDDAIRAADAEIGGDWTHDQRSKLLKELGGEVEETTTEPVAAPKKGSLDTVAPSQALADPMLREIETAQLTADPFTDYPLPRPLITGEPQPAAGGIVGAEGYRQKRVEPNKPILNDEQQGIYDTFQGAPHVLKRDALEEVEANRQDQTLAEQMAAGRQQTANLPESQQNTDAQISPVAGLSEPVDTQVSPEKGEEGTVARHPWQMTAKEFADYDKVENERRSQYIDAEGNHIADSRTTPAKQSSLPLGTWRKQRTSWNKYGDTIEQLREIDLDKVRGVEDTGPDRMGDVERYAEWIKEGKNPPPFRVAQLADGTYQISDGHRRLLAYQKAGVSKVKAWVADSADTGLRDASGKVIDTDLTHQLAIKQALAEGKPVPPEVLADYPDLSPSPPSPKVEAPAPVGEKVLTREQLETKKMMLSDALELPDLPTKQRDRYRSELAKTDALLRGEKVSSDFVYSREVTGNPLVDTGHHPLLNNLIPIKVSTAAEAERKLFKIHDLLSEIRGEIAKANYAAKIAKTAAQKRAAAKKLSELEGKGYSQESIDEIVDVIEPELQRLFKEATDKLPTTETAQVTGETVQVDSTLHKSEEEKAAAPAEPDFALILSNLEKQTAVEKGKGNKGHWSVSDFQEYLKESYPTVAGMPKARVLSALRTVVKGKPVTGANQEVIDAFRHDEEGLRQKYGNLDEAAQDVADIFADEDVDDTLEFFEAIIKRNEERGKHVEPASEAEIAELFGEVPTADAKPDTQEGSGQTEATDDAGGWRQEVAVSAAKKVPTIGGVQKQGGKRQSTADLMDSFTQPPSLFSIKSQTDTPDFRNWFGDSKVVDAKGKPLVVYHGTASDVSEFDPSKSGTKSKTGAPEGTFFFSDRADVAGSYTVEWQGEWSQKFHDGGNVVPAFVSLQHPAKINAKGENWREILYKGEYRDINEIAEMVKATGKYDGIIVTRVHDKGVGALENKRPSTTYIAFDPAQIKSAIGNNGNFDPANPDIRYSTTESREDLTLERVRSSFPTLPVTEDNGTFTVVTPSGIPIRISKVGEIEFGPEQRAAAEKEYGRKLRDDERPVAEFRPIDHGAVINLTEKGIGELDHEVFHLAMSLSLTEKQKSAVLSVFKTEEKAAAEYQRLRDNGAFENDGPANLWLRKIYQFFRSLRELIAPTAKGVMRDIASGKVWDKAKGGEGGTKYATRRQQPQNLNAALDDLPPETKGQKFWRKMQDRYSRVGVIQDYLKEKGIQLSELANVSRGLSVMNGKIADSLSRFMDNKIHPLVEEAAKHKVSLGDIEEFLLMQHAEEANEQMRKLHDDPDVTAFGVTDQEAQQSMADFRARADFAQLERIANKFRALSDDTANMLVREGIISQDMKDAWESAYQHYVPLRGGDEDTKQGTGKGLRVNGKQQRRGGHGRRDEHVIENIIKSRERAVKAVEKNKVALSVAQLIKEVGDDRIGTIEKPERRRIIKSQKMHTVFRNGEAVASFPTEQGAKDYIAQPQLFGAPLRRDSDVFETRLTHDQSLAWVTSRQLGENEINAYVNGHQVRIQINDEVAAKALTHGGIEELATIFKFGKMINNYLSRIYTGYDPRFTIRNTARDFTAGMINLTGDYGAKAAAKIALNYPKAVKELLKARKDPTNSQWIDRYRKAGGSTGASWLPSIERLGEKLEDAYHEQIGAIETYRQVYDKEIAAGSSAMKAGIKAGAASGVAKFKGIPVLGHYLRIIEAMNSVSENAFRVATFKTLVEEGKSDREAGEAAKSSTINFDKRGELGNQIGALYLFFNPAIQGVRRTGKALFESEHKFQAQAMAGSMAFVGFMAAELARSMWDDDEWDKIPRSVKNRNLVLRTSEKGQITVPIPYDYGTFVGVGYALSDMAHGKADWRTGLNLAGTIMDAVSFAGNPITDKGEISVVPVVPTLMKMLLAPSVNVNNFGSEIYPDKAEWKPDSQNMYRNTKGTGYAKAAKRLNELTGGTKYTSGMVDVSPEVLKFYTRSIFGGAASFVMEVNDFTNVMINGEKPDISEVPLANVVMRENTVRDTRAKFYEIASQAGKAAAAFNAAKRDRAFDIAAQLKDKDSELIAISRVASTQKKLAKAKRDALDAIRLDEDLSFAEKREKMRLIERQEEMIYDRLIRKFNQKD